MIYTSDVKQAFKASCQHVDVKSSWEEWQLVLLYACGGFASSGCDVVYCVWGCIEEQCCG